MKYKRLNHYGEQFGRINILNPRFSLVITTRWNRRPHRIHYGLHLISISFQLNCIPRDVQRVKKSTVACGENSRWKFTVITHLRKDEISNIVPMWSHTIFGKRDKLLWRKKKITPLRRLAIRMEEQEFIHKRKCTLEYHYNFSQNLMCLPLNRQGIETR